MHLCECVFTKYIFSNTKSLFVNPEMGILVVHTFVLCRIVLCVKCTTNRTLHLVCCFGPGLAVWAFTLLVDKHAFEARSKIMKSRLTVSNVSISKCLFRKFENFTLFLNFIAFLDIWFAHFQHCMWLLKGFSINVIWPCDHDDGSQIKWSSTWTNPIKINVHNMLTHSYTYAHC